MTEEEKEYWEKMLNKRGVRFQFIIEISKKTIWYYDRFMNKCFIQKNVLEREQEE
jgi:hypothetical protein